MPLNLPHDAIALQAYDFIELWAGAGMVSEMVGRSGRNIAALDIDYFEADPNHPKRSNHYDILTTSGFACHVVMQTKSLKQLVCYPQI